MRFNTILFLKYDGNRRGVLITSYKGTAFRPGSFNFWVTKLKEEHSFSLEKADRNIAVNIDEIQEVKVERFKIVVKFKDELECPISETFHRHLKRIGKA
ncbi:LytTR family transcriptional regulator DNA-binding domain-containing protein [Paenibacillus xylanexedens]|uniref:LytTR family transcriptional regulator DNA-binding domain-containing protein n=1 Tax=Paenibacillus xylanexedens TaxID=528191 RepID=UPI000F532469